MCSNMLDLPATQTLCVQENSCPMDQGVKLWLCRTASFEIESIWRELKDHHQSFAVR